MEKVMDRIRKLLALARHNTSPEEAALAASRAQELMDEHNLEEHELSQGVGAPELPIEEGEFFGERYQRRLPSWRARLAIACARTSVCQVFWREYGFGLGRKLIIVGRRDDAQVATYLYEFLATEIERLCREAMARLPALEKTRSFANNFRLGAAVEVGSRLHERLRARRTAPAAIDRSVENDRAVSTALVLMGHEARVQSYMTNLRLRGARRRTGTVSRPSAYASGREAGRGIALDRHGGPGLPSPARKLKE